MHAYTTGWHTHTCKWIYLTAIWQLLHARCTDTFADIYIGFFSARSPTSVWTWSLQYVLLFTPAQMLKVAPTCPDISSVCRRIFVSLYVFLSENGYLQTKACLSTSICSLHAFLGIPARRQQRAVRILTAANLDMVIHNVVVVMVGSYNDLLYTIVESGYNGQLL